MLISVCQGTFNGSHAFQGTAVQTANFIQMKGTGVCRFCFRWLFAFVRRGCCYCSPLQIIRFCRRRLLLCALVLRVILLHACTLFALVCAFALFGAVYLPFARLLLLLQYFARLVAFRAFLCALCADIQRI